MTNLTTRKGAKLELNGDILTGDTFAIKDYIKTYIDGKWVKDVKGWRINVSKLESLLSSSNSIGLRIDAESTAVATPAGMTYDHFRRSADDPNSDY